MSSAVTRAGQKWKEFWGSQITKNPQLEERKSEVNELNNYFQMADRTISGISQCHTQLQVLYNQCAMIVTKVYEHETGSNKLIATNLVKMFQKISELNGDKVTPLFTLKNELKLWFDTIDQLKILMERYQDDRLVYDHYKFKLDDLKNCKDSAKISRNERKFEKAQSTFQNVCLDMIGRMDRVISNKFSMINTVLSQLITLEAEISMNSYKSLQVCLNFDKDFSTTEQLSSSAHQQEGEHEDNFINKTRKLLSLPQEVNNSQKTQQYPQQPRQSQFQETPTPNLDPDPFEEFNKAQAQLAAGFSDAESPALFKNNNHPQDKQNQDQLKQQFQQQQLKQYQNIKKERKEDGIQVQQGKQNLQPPPTQQQPLQKPNIQEQQPQQTLTQSSVFASSNPFFQNQEEGNNFRPYQSVIMQPTQAWNPFNENQQQQQFKKVLKNPFDDDAVDNDYIPQQSNLAQSQSQILSQRMTNPFMETNTEEQIPNQRMFQTYQPQVNSNPFDMPQQQRQQQQSIQKNPFL